MADDIAAVKNRKHPWPNPTNPTFIAWTELEIDILGRPSEII